MAALSLADAKRHLRIDDDKEDILIGGLIAAAVDHVERTTGLVLEQRTVVESITGFGARLRTWPIVAIKSIEYVDMAGADQALIPGSYRLRASTRPARLANAGTAWPALGRFNGTVAVTMTAGYAEPSLIPAGVVQAIKMIVGHFYNNREAVVVSGSILEVPMAAEMLLSPHRLRSA